MKRKSRLHVHHLVGKWNENTCLEFWEKVAERFEIPTIKYRFNVCTDGNKQNPLAFQTVFSFGAVNFGKVKKIRKGQIVIGQIVQNVFGNMPKDEIKIRHIDGYCKRLRERVSRYCRRSSTFSKKRTAFEKHLQIFQVYNNFIDPYKEKKTPCMIEGITTKIWNWNDIFMHFYQSSW